MGGLDLRDCPGTSLADYKHLDASSLLDDPGLRLPPVVPCLRDGCNACFCSVACREAQLLRGHHRVLCTELPEERRLPWECFCDHARRHCETFLLAALVIAQAACDVAYGGVVAADAVTRYTQFAASPWPERIVCRDPAERQQWVERRHSMLQASFTLLADVFNGYLPSGLESLVEF